jgi:hypothetical protein
VALQSEEAISTILRTSTSLIPELEFTIYHAFGIDIDNILLSIIVIKSKLLLDMISQLIFQYILVLLMPQFV